MEVPKRDIGGFATEKIKICNASRAQRLQRGSLFRQVFLTGDPNGNVQTYNKTFNYIDNLASWLFSPVDLKFYLDAPGGVDPTQRAIFNDAASRLRQDMADSGVDSEFEESVLWALVKGKTFIKMLWSKAGLEPNLIQPEFMGVEREDLSTLDQQGCFFQTSWYTVDSFANLVSTNPDKDMLIKKAVRIAGGANDNERPDSNNMLKQVVLGGLYPYQAGGSGQGPKANGWVEWLGGPTSYMAPELLAKMIQIDELWCWDDDRDDYTTIQILSGDPDGVVFGKQQHRNIFADAFDPKDKDLKGRPNPGNPLKGLHPFVEVCPNKLNGYFWGRSEICNVGLLQLALNRRLDGINLLLRRQENPPRYFSGNAGVTQQLVSRLNKPGGWMSEANPNAKMQAAQPDLPVGLWESLKEIIQMFDDMGGMTPTLSGRGESGVRSQAQAETLVHTGTPRFKDRAVDVERSLSRVGDLSLKIKRAQDPTKYTAWVHAKDAGLESKAEETVTVERPPVPTMKPVAYQFHQIPEDVNISVDAHSSSPAFVQEAKRLAFDLAAHKAISPIELVRMTHPPREDEVIASIEHAEYDQAQLIKEHPELLTKKAGGRR